MWLHATALAHMAMYEKAEPFVLDVAARAWKRRTVQGQPGNSPGEHRGRKQEDQQQHEQPQEDLSTRRYAGSRTVYGSSRC